MPSPLRSTSVRLALGYVALFIASSLLLVSFLWWRTADYLGRKTDAAIAADAREIADQFRDFGLPGAIEAINVRVAEASGQTFYLLVDRQLKPLAGNLPAWPAAVGPKPGSYGVEIVADGQLHRARLLRVELPNGLNLLVGRDVEDQAELRSLILDGLLWAGGTAFLLAIGGGILVRRAVLRRVGMINDMASAIVGGDLPQRVPVRDTADAFDQLSQTINRMLEQIQQLIEGVRNTSNTVAHDLRTPLAELRAQLEELVRLRPSREAMLEGVHEAVADIDRLIGIFNALLRLVEIDSGVRRSGFRQVDLADIATEVAELYGPLIEDKKASFNVAVGDGLAVNGDPHLLAQAVGNLVDNAVKYAPRQGAVSLRIERRNDSEIDIVVSDTGPGIADADKPRATERFFRCNAGGKTEGTGLGLSLVAAVARLHDGRLTLDDNHPGLTATLRLPAAPELANL